MKNLRPERYFAGGQIVLGLCLLACLIIIPHYFFSLDQGGVSNYGTEARTKLLFVAGFGAATLGTFWAALTLPRTMSRRLQLRVSLYILAVLYLLVLLSTFSYKLSDSLRLLHEWAAIVLFVAGFVVALWLRLVAVSDVAAKRVFVLFCVSTVLSLLTVFDYFHLLFTVQIVCGISFGYLLTHAITALRTTSNR